MVSAQCPVLHGEVNRLMDLEGHVERVFCPEYVEAGECRLKREAMTGGPLSQLFERVDRRPRTPVHLCHVRAR